MEWDPDEYELHTKLYHISLMTTNLMAIILNGMFVVLFIRFRRRLLRRNNNKLLLSMAVADVCVGITGTVTGSLFHTKQRKVIYKLCGILPLFCSMYTSIISLGIMSLDRLIAIKFSLRYHLLVFPTRIRKVIMWSWMVPITLTMINVLLIAMADFHIELKFRNVLLTIIVTTSFTVLFVTNRILYSSICEQQRRMARVHVVHYNRNSEMFAPAEQWKQRKALTYEVGLNSMCIWVVNVFIICCFPLAVYRISYLLGRPPVLWLGRLSMCLATCNSVLNPCVYLIKRKEFRRNVKCLCNLP